MKMLRLYSTGDLSRCPLDKWGILDPGVYRRDEEGKGMERDDGEFPSFFPFFISPGPISFTQEVIRPFS